MIELAIAGAAGGFVKSIVEQKGAVVLPRYEENQDGYKYVHLGALANMFLGGIVAFYMSAEVLAAFTMGITAVFFVEKLLERNPVLNSNKKENEKV